MSGNERDIPFFSYSQFLPCCGEDKGPSREAGKPGGCTNNKALGRR